MLVLSAIPASARIYCCTDGNGRRVCGDILPVQCQTRAYNEFNPQGVLKKKYDAPLTPEQRVQRDAELAKKKAAEHAAAEQARRDKAMLASYNSVADIDAKRARTVTGAQADIKTAEERLEAVQLRLEKLRKSVERYNNEKKPVPESLQANLRDSEADMVMRQKTLELKKQELVTIQQHFDHDRQRFMELTGKNHGAAAAPAAPVR
ncbi:MAG: DUF4124 domain-containing protein [Rhodocyclales bacterium]|nr:DUF4124 domain-containing protein [Rhodocyclales bacterium]